MLTFRNIRRYINQNSKKIIFIVFILVFALTIIQALNAVAKQNNEKQLEKNEEDRKNVSNTTTQDNYSVISDKSISKQKNQDNITIIDEFFEKCKQQEIEEAYNLLSNECKKEQFNTLEGFIENYYNKVLRGKESYKIQPWIENEYTTYRVRIFENMLATGNANSGYVEDYYTIVKESGENKLNINSYIYTQNIDKEIEKDGVTIKLEDIKIYKDYQVYDVKIKNLNEETIMIDSKEKNNTVYIEDNNEGKYIGYMYEIPNNMLIEEQGHEKNLNIKFNKIYNKKTISKLCFSDIIRNYNEYMNSQDKSLYNNRMLIELEF